MSRIALAVAATFATLFLGVPNARVDDTAATPVAMPNRAAEQRYLMQFAPDAPCDAAVQVELDQHLLAAGV